MITDSAAISIEQLIAADVRFKTTSKGLARSLVWRNGIPPPQMGPNFGNSLTEYLQQQADRGVIASLRLVGSDNSGRVALGRTGFHRAAEAYESILRNGDEADPRRSLNRILAASSYHLAGYAASAFSVLRSVPERETPNLMLRVTALLLQRDISALDSVLSAASHEFYREAVARERTLTSHVWDSIAAEQNFAHSLALFVFAMRLNQLAAMDECLRRLAIGEKFSLEIGDVWGRLIYAICRPLMRELWNRSIMNSIPEAAPAGTSIEAWMAKRTLFGRVLGSRKIAEFEIWPSQFEAAARVFAGDQSFAAALPTSAGKTRIAEFAVFKTLLAGKRAVYVTPLRALSAQVERGFRKLFGPLGFSVSALYGAQGITPVDEATFDDNDIVVATPEKAGFALRNAAQLFDRVGLVVFDEAHLVSSESRGVAYEALVVALKRRADHQERRMLALSALLPDVEPTTTAFSNWLSDGAFQQPLSSPIVQGQSWRPTRQCFGKIHRSASTEPARFRYEIVVGGETSWVDDFVVQQERAPIRPKRTKIRFPTDRNDLALAAAEKLLAGQKSVLIYCPRVDTVDKVCSQYLAAIAAGFVSQFPIAENGTSEVERAVRIAEESLPHGSEIIAALRAGLAVHHAQLPRAFLREIDRLIALSIVRVVVASPTVNAGLNIAATCVLFNGCDRGEMERYQNPDGSFFFKNGEYIKSLKVLDGAESMNVAGRAGRAFVDTHGEVLGVCFDAKQEKRWTQLRERMAKRSFTSGLAAVLDRLIELLEGKSQSAEAIRTMIANSVDTLWAQPPVAAGDVARWEKAVQTLDQALLAFVDNLDADPANLTQILDQALNGSFFRAAIQNTPDEATCLLLVRSRGQNLWLNSTAEQRKGWYFAGVGLSDGLLLDVKAEIVAPLLARVESAIEFLGAGPEVIEWITEIAGHIFEIPTFQPKDGLPQGWQRILRLWLEGVSLQFIFSDPSGEAPGNDDYRAAAHFIEDGIIYRLTWGLEAVRVRRPELLGDDPNAPRRGLRCAAFLESGTLNPTVAVMLQIGLPSRRVAQEIVAKEGLDFLSVSGLRAWLRAQRQEPEARWAYLEAAIRPLWITFLSDIGTTETDEWTEKTTNLKVRERYQREQREAVKGLYRRVERKGVRFGEFQSADGVPLGNAEWPFGGTGPSIAEATLHPDGLIEMTYLGP